MRPIAAALALVAAVALTACSTDPGVRDSALPPGPFVACPATTASPAPVEGSGRPSVPDVVLPCFKDGSPVTLAGLGRPAIINLWASWCAPCIAELPEFQAYADRAGDAVQLVGVVTKDDPEAAVGLAEDLRLTFPAVFDKDGRLLRELGRTALPITLFVDAEGRIRFQYESTALAEETIATLAKEHLGVTVP